MRRLLFALIVVASSCGYDGSYRYPCQDPDNWDSSDCHRPACQVDGACPDILLGFDPFAVATTEMPSIPDLPTDGGETP